MTAEIDTATEDRLRRTLGEVAGRIRPADRWKDVIAGESASTSAQPETTSPDPPRQVSRRRVLLAAAAVVAIAGVGAAAVALLRDDDSEGRVVASDPEARRAPSLPPGVPQRWAELWEDAGRLREYLDRPFANPGSLGAIGFTDDDPVRVRVAVGGDVAARRAELIRLVDHPDRLDVVPAQRDPAYLASVTAVVEQLVPDDISVFGASDGSGRPITVTLPAGNDAIAADLLERFGTDVLITVGMFGYPFLPGEAAGCPDLSRNPQNVAVPGPESLPGVSATARPDRTSYAPGDLIQGEVTIRNSGSTAIAINTGGRVQVGHLVEPATGQVVATFEGVRTMEVKIENVQPGADLTVPFRSRAGSCRLDPAYGTTLPAGTYHLVVAAYEARLDGPVDAVRYVLSHPVDVEITE